jgi:hypothetical protein
MGATVGATSEVSPSLAAISPVLRDEPEPYGFPSSFAAVPRTELAQDRRDVVIDCLAGQEQALCDLLVPQPLCE